MYIWVQLNGVCHSFVMLKDLISVCRLVGDWLRNLPEQALIHTPSIDCSKTHVVFWIRCKRIRRIDLRTFEQKGAEADVFSRVMTFGRIRLDFAFSTSYEPKAKDT